MPTTPRSPSVSLRLAGHPDADATSTTGLVVEGGGARGMFCAGVLDALATDAAPFDIALGSSAGALVLAAHLAGQHGMAAAAYTDHMLRPGIVDRFRFLRGGPLFDLDTLWDEMHREQPLDLGTLLASPTSFRVVVTDVATGQAHHLSPDDHDTWSLLKASCALPLLYGRSVDVSGRDYIDGGYSDPLPVHEAQAMGAQRILVIRTRPLDTTGDTGPGAWGGRGLVSWSLRRHPGLSQQVGKARTRYATSLEFTRNPPDGTVVLEVAPSRPLASGGSTGSVEGLQRDYALGLRAGSSAAAVWSGLRAGVGSLAA